MSRRGGKSGKSSAPPPPALDDDERALFSNAMQGVRKLHLEPTESGWQTTARPAPRPRSLAAGGTHGGFGEASTDDALDHPDFAHRSTSTLAKQLRKKVEKRRVRIDMKLDLHGKTVLEAQGLLSNFIDNASHNGMRYLIVVHGKGFNSPNGLPVLRPAVEHWLDEHPAVAVFTYTADRDGGSGASYVQLRKMP